MLALVEDALKREGEVPPKARVPFHWCGSTA
jgi:hypothetical protein